MKLENQVPRGASTHLEISLFGRKLRQQHFFQLRPHCMQSKKIKILSSSLICRGHTCSILQNVIPDGPSGAIICLLPSELLGLRKVCASSPGACMETSSGGEGGSLREPGQPSDEREGLGKGIKWHRKDKAWELRRHQQM